MELDDPIQQLRREHEVLLGALDQMEFAAAELGLASHAAALESLHRALEVLDRDMREHGVIEEQVFYPALGRHLPMQTIAAALEEHRELRWKIQCLGRALEAETPSSKELRRHATALVDLFRRHIHRENNVLFMMASQMLSDREYAALQQAMQSLTATIHKGA